VWSSERFYGESSRGENGDFEFSRWRSTCKVILHCADRELYNDNFSAEDAGDSRKASRGEKGSEHTVV